jgi:hypothetical protein
MQHKKGKLCFYITLVETSMHGIKLGFKGLTL